jgi:hypothetical protein
MTPDHKSLAAACRCANDAEPIGDPPLPLYGRT